MSAAVLRIHLFDTLQRLEANQRLFRQYDDGTRVIADGYFLNIVADGLTEEVIALARRSSKSLTTSWEASASLQHVVGRALADRSVVEVEGEECVRALMHAIGKAADVIQEDRL